MSKAALRSVAVIAAATMMAASCSSPPSASVIDASQFAAAYAQALCTSLEHCCSENLVTFDYAACTAGWRARVDDRFVHGTVNYDSRAATECLAQVRAAKDHTCELMQGSVADARDTCSSIFQGQKAAGVPCTNAAECAPVPGSRVGCETNPAVGDGGVLPLDFHFQTEAVCVVLSPIVPGDPCALEAGQPGVADCGDQLYCDTRTAKCQARAQGGEACVAGGCDVGNFCDRSTAEGTCTESLAVGTKCSAADQCDGTTRCDLAGTKTCISRSDAGIACTLDSDCLSGACDRTTMKCLKNTFATSAACTGAGY